MKKISALLCAVALCAIPLVSAQTAYFSVNNGTVVYDDEYYNGVLTDYITDFYGNSSCPHPVYVTIQVTGYGSQTKTAWTSSNPAVVRAPEEAKHTHSYVVDTSISQTRSQPIEE